MRSAKQHQLQKEAFGSLNNSQINELNNKSELNTLMSGEDTNRKPNLENMFRSTHTTFSQSGKPPNVADLFYKSHVSGFGGLKKKYHKKQMSEDYANTSYQTSFYRTQNMRFLGTTENNTTKEDGAMSPKSSVGNKSSIMKVTFSPRCAEEVDVSQNENISRFRDASKPVVPLKSYLTNDINLKTMLKKYRKSMEKKYPDPVPANAEGSHKESQPEMAKRRP